jgi:hypothetical protein
VRKTREMGNTLEISTPKLSLGFSARSPTSGSTHGTDSASSPSVTSVTEIVSDLHVGTNPGSVSDSATSSTSPGSLVPTTSMLELVGTPKAVDVKFGDVDIKKEDLSTPVSPDKAQQTVKVGGSWLSDYISTRSAKYSDIDLQEPAKRELLAVIINMRRTVVPVLEFVAMLSSITSKPVSFYAYFTTDQIQKSMTITNKTTVSEIFNELSELPGGQMDNTKRLEFVRRFLILILAFEYDRRRHNNSTFLQLADYITELANEMSGHINIETMDVVQSDLLSLIFRESFKQMVLACYLEIQNFTKSTWSSAVEICSTKSVAFDFARYIGERIRMDEYKGYRSKFVVADHYSRLRAHAENIKSNRSAAYAVAPRSGESFASSYGITYAEQQFYGNAKSVYDALSKEIGDEIARQYQPHIKEFAVTETVEIH